MRGDFAMLAGLALQSAAPASGEPFETGAENAAAIRITPRTDCGTQGRASGEILVCGQRDRGDQYRVPKILRERRPDRSGTSWGAQTREFEEDLRNGDTVTGLGGGMKHHRQWIREWKAEREAIARDKAEQKRLIEAGK